MYVKILSCKPIKNVMNISHNVHKDTNEIHEVSQPGSQASIDISYKIKAYMGMLILYTTVSTSTAGEVISTALYSKHQSYSLGERSGATPGTIGQHFVGPEPRSDTLLVQTSVLTSYMLYKSVPVAGFERSNQYATPPFGYLCNL